MHECQDDNNDSQGSHERNVTNNNNNSNTYNNHSSNNNLNNHPVSNSSGYYNAEKCRSYIANQIKVSKIDRFAAQIGKALEIEVDVHSRLGNISKMFTKISSRRIEDFATRCKFGIQNHKQDRILNQQRKSCKKVSLNKVALNTMRQYSLSNDLLYGEGAQMVQALLRQTVAFTKHIKRKVHLIEDNNIEQDELINNNNNNNGKISENDYILAELFEPSLFAKQLEELIMYNIEKSRQISMQFHAIGQQFEKLAAEHRDQVDLVYAAEEERQATTVIRRSAYNLSIAAIKATSTPIHVNTPNDNLEL